jgi:hypothetical protein
MYQVTVKDHNQNYQLYFSAKLRDFLIVILIQCQIII